jgi:phage terminase Nu1 subunit (DNA packaging protein)
MADQKQNLADIARKKRHLHLIEKMQSRNPLSKSEIIEIEQFEAEPLAPSVVKTMEEVAKVMDVSYRTVQRWKQDGMPTTKDGFYDLDEIKAWHVTRNEDSLNEFKDRKEYWEDNILEYKATMLELELKKATGEVVSRDEVEKGRVARVMMIKREFLSLPRIMAPKLAMREPREIEAELYEVISTIIDDFSGVKDAVENGKGNIEPAGTAGVDEAASDNGEPVGGSVSNT